VPTKPPARDTLQRSWTLWLGASAIAGMAIVITVSLMLTFAFSGRGRYSDSELQKFQTAVDDIGLKAPPRCFLLVSG
jgi:hypothetical protein